jgi:hypothetical protein
MKYTRFTLGGGGTTRQVSTQDFCKAKADKLNNGPPGSDACRAAFAFAAAAAAFVVFAPPSLSSSSILSTSVGWALPLLELPQAAKAASVPWTWADPCAAKVCKSSVAKSTASRAR